MLAKAKVLPLPAAVQASVATPVKHQPVAPLVLIRLPEVLRRLSVSKTWLYQKMKDPKDPFPSAVDLGGKSRAWVEIEVENFIQSRITARGVK
ncbi:helix-turn-helix transcriptional regulator [Deefgea salmonis]|uniref:AlpA family phage regulatory protein n=1 Tax=Deefgea salmonis TaxID=2875502 RepID=A0ABS8BM98_9NEIS|nr:AlpA family phage regulatory protein [Deefgea salmonis]MCB5196863.1 AlpA family phage regulatory protein [Deefgea salmonis]